MAIQKIMVPFLNEEPGLSALAAAAAIADRFKAHIDVVHLRPTISPAQVAGGFSGGYYPIAVDYVESTVKEFDANAQQQAADLNALFAAFCDKYDIARHEQAAHSQAKGAAAAWSDIGPATTFDFSKRARVADLAVIAKTGADATLSETEMFEDLVFQSGRPVLITPSNKSGFAFPEQIIVAWDGGREAARAVAGALPILREARLVSVVSVGEIRAGSESAERAAAHLKLHGVHATSVSLDVAKGADAEQAFLTHAIEDKMELIVMGAYSHSRWREVIWGGFTRELLRQSEIPLLMAH
ncbi:MAG: universal stress protein [Pseudomonadota bacterium]